MGDYVHTFNINIKSEIDEALRSSDLTDDQRKLLTEARTLITKPPNEVASQDVRSRIDNIARELSSSGSKAAKDIAVSLEKELSNAMRKVAYDFSSKVGRDLLKGVSVSGLKPEPASQALSRIGAAQSDNLKVIQEDFVKFKKELLDVLRSTFERELNNRFRVVGDTVEKAFSTGASGNEQFRVVNVQELEAVLAKHGVETGRNASLEQKLDALSKHFIALERSNLGANAPSNRLSDAEIAAVARYVKREGYRGEDPNLRKALAGTSKLSDIERLLRENVKTSDQVINVLKDTISKKYAQESLGAVTHTIPIPTPTIAPGGVPGFRTNTGYIKGIETNFKFTPGLLAAAEAVGKDFKNMEEAFKQVHKALLSMDPAEIEKTAATIWTYTKTSPKLASRVIDAAAKVLPGREGKTDDALKASVLGTNKSLKQMREKALKEIEADMKKYEITYGELFRAMSSLTKGNVFDEIISNLTTQKEGVTSPVVRLAQQLPQDSDKAVAWFLRSIKEPTNQLDIISPERPLASMQASRTVRVTTPNLLTTSENFMVSPQEQVRAVQALNNELLLSEKYLNKTLSTLGMSEGKASHFIYEGGKAKTSPTLGVSMYAGDIKQAIPFGQMWHEGRVVYPVSQARLWNYIDQQGRIRADLPSTRSTVEQAAISNKLVPQSGYGMNLVTKLVDSARVFEDQIAVSERVFKSFSTVVRRILTEAEGSSQDVARKLVEESPELFGTRLNKNADSSVITEVSKIIGAGGNVERKALQVVDTIFSSLSTKITTRFGSKGTLTYVPQETLGYTERPLSVVEMMSKLLTKAGKENYASLVEKRGIMPFIPGVEHPDDLKGKYSYIRSRAKETIKSKFGVELSTDPVKMAEQLKLLMEKEFGKEALKVKVPVDVQMSIKGLTKRLNTSAEVAEAMAATIGGGVNVIPGGGKDQRTLYDVLNKIGGVLGYGAAKVPRGEDLNFLSPVETVAGGRRSVERAIVGNKFFVMTGDKNEQTPWTTKEMVRGERGISLNPAGLAAFLSRYSPNTALGRMTIDQFIPNMRDVEVAKELFKMREPKQEGASFLDLAKFRSLPVGGVRSDEDLKGTILESPELYKKTGLFPNMVYNPITGMPQREGVAPTYIPSQKVLSTYFNADLGVTLPTKITSAYDTLLSSTQRLMELKQGATEEAGTSIDTEFLRPHFREVLSRRLNESRLKFREASKLVGQVGRGKLDAKEADELISKLLENEGKFLEKLRPLYKILQDAQKNLPSGNKQLIPSQFADLDRMLSLLEPVISGQTPFRQVARGKGNIDTILGGLRSAKDLFVRTNEDQATVDRFNDMMRMKAEGTAFDYTTLSESTVEYIKRGFRGGNPLAYGWGKALGLGPSQGELAKEQKVAALDLLVKGQEVPKNIEGILKNSIRKLLSGTIKSFASPGLLNLASEQELIKAAGSYGFPVQSSHAFERYKEEAKIAQAQEVIRSFPEQSLVGKGKGVQQLQERTLPAVAGQTFNAVVNKMDDFKEAAKILTSISSGNESLTAAMKSLMTAHGKFVADAEAAGEVMLREGEVGVSAKDYNLLVPKYARGRFARSGAQAYAETARFPLTGEYSFQPALLRQVELKSPELKARYAKSIAVPGIAGGIDYDALTKARTEGQRMLADLRQKRAALPGGADDQRAKLTAKINDVIKALTLLEVKFRAGAQNLDYDGDPIYVHTTLMKQTNRHLRTVNEELASMKGSFKGTDAEFKALAKQKRAEARRLDQEERLRANEEIKMARQRFKTGLSGGAVSPIAAMQLAFVKERFDENTSLSSLDAVWKKRRGLKDIEDGVSIMGQTYTLDELRPEVKKQYLENFYAAQGKSFSPETILKAGGIQEPSQQAIDKLINNEFKARIREGSIQKYLAKPFLGLSTETANQLARVAERTYSLGTNESPYDLSKALGNPALSTTRGAYATHRMHQMSGLLQYLINAGMTVKHGSSAPKYEEMPKLLLTGKMNEAIRKGGIFEGFAKEAAAFEDAVRLNLEALSTKDFDREVKNFFGKSLKDLEAVGKTRKEITEEVVNKLGFKGLFHELRSTIVQHYADTKGLDFAEADKGMKKYVESDQFNWFKMLEEMFPAYKVRTSGFAARANTPEASKFLDLLQTGSDVSGMMMRAVAGKPLEYPTLTPQEYNKYRAVVSVAPTVAGAAGAAGGGSGGGPPKKPPVVVAPVPEEPEKPKKQTEEDVPLYYDESGKPVSLREAVKSRSYSSKIKSAILSAFPDMASVGMQKDIKQIFDMSQTDPRLKAKFSKIEGSAGKASDQELRQLIGAFGQAVLENEAKKVGKSLKDYVKALEAAEKAGKDASEQVINDAEEAKAFLTKNMSALKVAAASGGSALGHRAIKALGSYVTVPRQEPTEEAVPGLDPAYQRMLAAEQMFPTQEAALRHILSVAKGKGIASIHPNIRERIPAEIMRELETVLEQVRRNPTRTREFSEEYNKLLTRLAGNDESLYPKLEMPLRNEYHATKLQGILDRLSNVQSERDRMRLESAAVRTISYKQAPGTVRPFDATDEKTRLAHIRLGTVSKEQFQKERAFADKAVAAAFDELISNFMTKPYEGLQRSMQILSAGASGDKLHQRLGEFKTTLDAYIGATLPQLEPGELDTLQQVRKGIGRAQTLRAKLPEAMRDIAITGAETPTEFSFKKGKQVEALKEAMLTAAEKGQITAGYELPYLQQTKGEQGEIFKIRRRLRAVQGEGGWSIQELPAKGSMLASDFGKSVQGIIQSQSSETIKAMLQTLFAGRGTGISATSNLRSVYTAAITGEKGELSGVKASRELGGLVEVLKKIRAEARGIDDGIYQEVSFFINELNRLVRNIHKAGGDLAQVGPAMSTKGVSYETPETARKMAVSMRRDYWQQAQRMIASGEIKPGFKDIFKTFGVDEQGRVYEQRYRTEVKETESGKAYLSFRKLAEDSFGKLATRAVASFKEEPKRGAMTSLIQAVSNFDKASDAMQSVLRSVRTFDKAKGEYVYKRGAATNLLEYKAALQEMLVSNKDQKGNILTEQEISAIKALINELGKLTTAISTDKEGRKTKTFAKYGGVSEEEFNRIEQRKVERARQAVEQRVTRDLLEGRKVRRGQAEVISYKERIGEQEYTRKAAITVERRGILGGYKVTAQQAPTQQLATGSRFGTAMSRVMMWGAASGLVYGALAQTRALMTTMVDVESKMAELKKVMPSITTNFNDMRDAAVGFAKDYGAELTEVLDTMRIFAQQGLSAPEVKEMTRVSTLASNVTTMDPAKAAESLTAATRQFNMAAEDSIKILDAWNEVENNFAITSENLADAIKKSGTAARVVGVDFNKLNGYVTAIGEATRQTGKEIGTSLRFIFSRLNTEKAPKALAGVGIDTTVGGNVRPGSEVLDELAKKWDTLNEAQKLSIAQAMGGIRQYNAVMVLMENYGRALEASAKSLHSIGSAERENQIVMETTRKKLAAMKASYDELAVKASDTLLPFMKGGIALGTGALNVLNAVPGGGLAAGIGAGYLGATALEKWFNLSMFGLTATNELTGARERKPLFFKKGFAPGEAFKAIRAEEGLGAKWKAIRGMTSASRGASILAAGEEGLAAAGAVSTVGGLATIGTLVAVVAALIAVFKLLEAGVKDASGATEEYADVVKASASMASELQRSEAKLPAVQYDLAKAKALEQTYKEPGVLESKVASYDYKSPLLLRKKSFETLRSVMTDVVMLTGSTVDEMDGFGRAIIGTTKNIEGLANSIEDVLRRLTSAKEEAYALNKGLEVSANMRKFTEAGSSKGFLGSMIAPFARAMAGSDWGWVRELGAKAQTPYERVVSTRAKLHEFQRENPNLTMPTADLYRKNPAAYEKQMETFTEYQRYMQEFKAATEQYQTGVLEQKKALFSAIPSYGIGAGAAASVLTTPGVPALAKIEYGLNRSMYNAVVPEEKVGMSDVLASYYLKLRGVNAGPSTAMTLELARQAGMTTQGSFTDFLKSAQLGAEALKTGTATPGALLSRQVMMFNPAQVYGTGESKFRIGAGQVLMTPTSAGGMVEYTRENLNKKGEVTSVEVVVEKVDDFARSLAESTKEVEGFKGALQAVKLERAKTAALYTSVEGAAAGMVTPPREKALSLGRRFGFQVATATRLYNKQGGYGEFIKQYAEQQQSYRFIQAQIQKAEKGGKTVSPETLNQLQKLAANLNGMANIAIRVSASIEDMNKALESSELTFRKNQAAYQTAAKYNVILSGPLAGKERAPTQAMAAISQTNTVNAADLFYSALSKPQQAGLRGIEDMLRKREALINKSQIIARTKAEVEYIQGPEAAKLRERVKGIDVEKAASLTQATGAGIGSSLIVTELSKQTGLLQRIADNTSLLSVDTGDLGTKGSAAAYFRQAVASGSFSSDTYGEFVNSEVGRMFLREGATKDDISKFLQTRREAEVRAKGTTFTPSMESVTKSLVSALVSKAKGFNSRSYYSYDTNDKIYTLRQNAENLAKKVAGGWNVDFKELDDLRKSLEAVKALVSKEKSKTTVTEARDDKAVTKSARDHINDSTKQLTAAQDKVRQQLDELNNQLVAQISSFSGTTRALYALSVSAKQAYEALLDLPKKIQNINIEAAVSSELVKARSEYANLGGGLMEYQTPNLGLDRRLYMSQYSTQEYLYNTNPEYRSQATQYQQDKVQAEAARRSYEAVVSARARFEAVGTTAGLSKGQISEYLQGISITGSEALGPLFTVNKDISDNTRKMVELLSEIAKKTTKEDENKKLPNVYDLEKDADENRRRLEAKTRETATGLLGKEQVEMFRRMTIRGGGLSAGGYIRETLLSKGSAKDELNRSLARAADIINKSVINSLVKFADTVEQSNRTLAINNRLAETRATYRNIRGGPLQYQTPQANLDLRTSMSQFSPHELLYNSSAAYRNQTLQYTKAVNAVNAARQKEEAFASLRGNLDFLKQQYGIRGAENIAAGVLTTGSVESGAIVGELSGISDNTDRMVDLLEKLVGETEKSAGVEGRGAQVQGGTSVLNTIEEALMSQRMSAETTAGMYANQLRAANIAKQTEMDIAGGRYMSKEQFVREQRMAAVSGGMSPEIYARNVALLKAGEAEREQRQAFEYNKSKILETLGKEIGGIDSLVSGIQSGVAGVVGARYTRPLDTRFQQWAQGHAADTGLVADRQAQYELAKNLYNQVLTYNAQGVDVGIEPSKMLSLASAAAGGKDIIRPLEEIAQELSKVKQVREAQQRQVQATEFADAMASIGNVPVVDAINEVNRSILSLKSTSSGQVGQLYVNGEEVPTTRSPKVGQLYINGEEVKTEPVRGRGKLLINGEVGVEPKDLKALNTTKKSDTENIVGAIDDLKKAFESLTKATNDVDDSFGTLAESGDKTAKVLDSVSSVGDEFNSVADAASKVNARFIELNNVNVNKPTMLKEETEEANTIVDVDSVKAIIEEELATKLADITDTVGDIGDRVSAIENSEVATQLLDISTTISEISAAIVANETDVETIKNNIDTVNVKLTSLDAVVTDMYNTVSTVELGITNLESDTESTFNSVKMDITDLRSLIESLRISVIGLQSQFVVSM